MRPFLLSDAAGWCEGRLLGADATVGGVGIDSRTVEAGGLFVALRGEQVDGHAFVAAAAERGAAGALVARPVDADLPQIVCGDTQTALGDIAAALAETRSTTVIGITGSNGKTSTKTLTHAILSQVGSTYANPGNFNNELGLPLALIDQPEDARFGICEMGAGQPGDIAYLAAIARPRIALVNNVAAAHLERMGSLLGVAQTKGAIYDALPPDGVAVINADDAFGPYFAQRAAPRRVVRFGIDATAEVFATAIEASDEGTRFTLHTPIGEIAVALPLGGRHQLMNALAAASIALAADAPLQAIAAGLAAAPRVPGRQQPHRLESGALLLDDSYNANPGSVAAAIASLAAAARRESGAEAWLVLGDMRELGEGARHLHAEVGDAARDAGIRRLFTVGELSAAATRAFGPGARHFDDQAGLADALRDALHGNVICLVKGSRGSRMDRIVAMLLGAESSGVHHAA
ncbi:UDP-N-acetylmuramoyl-tripeptide--D-alanyl-D-alanine ligase [Chiayiivirga flava]|uniref:UDP-N-acetylmuramoyl-tripeptide--D-alanyl-D-alanine ligase n=1 Tax=Chiayiivirga flava TaxID=659595 RepID=A0A7W8D753_9GAMM|nr:UDP-N-acetylmuramoyl-tripeptide--D-alanyl-D-alanine ligase [Chiayiivirga flava]MBB5208782.1 UDP-N-acetylmuramoyl-tripeptide--D-alanyl-D-alanine ligase [Chiayiivirga flava]